MRSNHAGAVAAVLAAAVVCASTPAFAQQEIVIGHVAGYTGPVAADANGIGLGARIFIDATNDRGGVDGKKMRLVVADDHYKPDETSKFIAGMIGKVSALLPTVGAANLSQVMKDGILDNVTLPLVGTIPSPDVLRNPIHKNIFHFRAGDREQIEKIVEQLTTTGLTRIAAVTNKNPASAERAAIIAENLQKRNLKLIAHAVFETTNQIDFAPVMKALDGKQAQAIVVIGPAKPIGLFIKELKARGETAQICSLSYADHRVIVDTAGTSSAHGVILSQVLPNPNNKVIPIVKQFRDDFAKYAKTTEEPQYLNLEGYISAKLIAEAIRRTKDSSPEGVRKGLEQMRSYDIGGYTVDLSPTKHTGSIFVDLAVVSSSGKLVH